jgi:hypothetical protein
MITFKTMGEYNFVKLQLNKILQHVNEKKTSQAVGKNNIIIRTDVSIKDFEKGNIFLDLNKSVGHPSFTKNKKDVLPLLESQRSKSAYSAIKSIWMRKNYLLVGTGVIRKTFNSGSDKLKNSWCQIFRKNEASPLMHCFWFINNKVYYSAVHDYRKVD